MSTGAMNILLVDDEPKNLVALRALLDDMGARLVDASSGLDALRALLHEEFALIVMDVRMPGMDGFETAALIRQRERSASTPIIFVSGEDRTEDAIFRGYSVGAVDYIVKPLNPEVLRSKVQVFLDLHRKTLEIQRQAELLRLAEAREHARRMEEERLRSRAEASAALEREVRERRLEEERLKVTLRCIADGVVTTDTAGRVLLMSQAAEALTGWTQAEAAGTPLAEVFHVRDERTGNPAEVPVGVATPETAGALAPREGDDRIVLYRAAPILSGDGEVLGTVLVFRDITERRVHEQEMLKASKLESIGVLAGGIAHDFNNLLTGITASVSLAQMNLERGRPVGERLRSALLACDRARRLTQQLLTFARGGDLVKQVVAIDDLVRESASFALQGSRSRLQLDVQEGLWAVEADPGQVSQVVHNLVINADQAMPDGGHILVRVRNQLVGDRNGPPAPGPYVVIDVEDGGTGVPAEVRDKIFDPFFTTKPKGSGLGLATVYSILQRHHGHVELASRPGRTVFTLYLPSFGEPAEEPETAEIVRVAGGNGRVLVMDDEGQIRDVAREALVALGYDVATARDGQEAIEMFRAAQEQGRRFEIVIMDLTVPGGMGGREAIGHIRGIDPCIRALVSSGYSTDPVVGSPKTFGFDGVISKPWNVTDLDVALRKLATAS